MFLGSDPPKALLIFRILPGYYKTENQAFVQPVLGLLPPVCIVLVFSDRYTYVKRHHHCLARVKEIVMVKVGVVTY